MSVLRLIAVCLCVAEMGGFYLHFFTFYAPHNTIFRQPETFAKLGLQGRISYLPCLT
ncbi:hypothetical protein [Alysiella filiformis]|nr:hypothetical protein [Alysiella filiformis]QMT32102.1 hypothetical protein H3L97_04340 [Alysiella filiformis]UBQ56988.1 hypothetical protein JF568_04335 [Alysiella filiformis DSM 16848]